MAYDCAAAQAELTELKNALHALAIGKRTITNTYGDQSTSTAMVSVSSLNDLIKAKETEMLTNGCSLASGKTASPRFAQPSFGSGRDRFGSCR